MGQSDPTCTCTKDIDWNILDTQCPAWRSKSANPCSCKQWNSNANSSIILPCIPTTTSSVAASTAVIDALKIACPTATITSQNFGSVNDLGDFKCCEENGDGSTKLDKCTQEQLDWNIPCTVQWSNLYWKPHSKNSIRDLSCTCNQWYTEIDSVCEPCDKEWVCCGVSLNTNVPFIGDCIESKADDPSWISSDQAFPVLMWSLVKILVTVILILSFVLIIIGGIMIATGDAPWGKKMIIKVVIGIALLGASGVILRLINPNFFG